MSPCRNPQFCKRTARSLPGPHPAAAPLRPGKRRNQPALLAAAVFAGMLLGLPACRRAGAGKNANPSVFTVKQGDLDITITESGTIQAAHSVVIANEVTRPVRILEMVDEGTIITPEDVKKGKILLRFDDTSIQEDMVNRKTEFEAAKAALTQAKEALAIQKSANESSIRKAELNLLLAMNDFRKLIGDKLAERYQHQKPADIGALLDDPDLGGKSLQDLRTFQSNIELQKEELSRAENKLKWTEKLHAKGYVTANDEEADKLALRRQQLNLQNAQATLRIYRMYDFVNAFQKQWSAVLEAQEAVTRAKATARRKMAQAQAALNSSMAGFNWRKDQVARLQKDLDHCIVRAKTPGLVILRQPPRWRSAGPPKVGDQVAPRQVIYEIPDISCMIAKISVHEASIDQVALGQHVVVKVDAVPGKRFNGKVTRKALVPSARHSWLNPDLKLYAVEVTITDPIHGLRPGMTCTAEILVQHLTHVVYVPIEAIQTAPDGSLYCYRADGAKVPVKTGKRNLVFVVIRKGLKPGDKILLTPPQLQ